ncbi:MAG: putative O-glycosylation ligase, exosortase A system-associated [Burkholderiales bacterium]|nr:putative O-glycosylation ligase, exosortase A system-associated [Burkholderiales bacterium]
MLLLFMPDEWWERMGTIKTYEQDESAMGRINAWWMTWNLAKDRFFGGGFEIYDTHVFGLYAPIPEDVHAAHSIYFQVLGEHGFGGLFFYLCVWFSTWFTIRWVRKNAKARQQQWAVDLASMSEVSLIGYAVGGAFLSLSYFDLPYYLVVMMVVLRYKLFAPGGEYASASTNADNGAPAGTPIAQPPPPTTTLDTGRGGS